MVVVEVCFADVTVVMGNAEEETVKLSVDVTVWVAVDVTVLPILVDWATDVVVDGH